MKWNKFTIKTTTLGEDFLSAMLSDLGIEGIEIEDNVPLTKQDQAEMFIDFLPELPPDEGIGYVSFYLEDGEGFAEFFYEIFQEKELEYAAQVYEMEAQETVKTPKEKSR